MRATLPQTHILLKGYYDFFNFGDDLLLMAILNFFQEELQLPPESTHYYIEPQKNSIPVLKAAQFKPLQAFHEPIKQVVKAQRERGQGGMLAKLHILLLFGWAYCNAILYRLIGRSPFLQDTFAFYQQLDAVHYIGGGYFTSIWPFSLPYLIYEWLTLGLIRLINPKVSIQATGLGVGPIESKLYAKLFQQFLQHFDALSVREEISLKLVKTLCPALPCENLGDDVLLLYPYFKSVVDTAASESPNKSVFALNLKQDQHHDYAALQSILEATLSEAQNRQLSPCFFCFGVDHYALNQLSEKARQSLTVINPYEQGIEAFLTNLAKAQSGLGFAYHFTIVTTLMGIPTLNVYSDTYYQQKIGGVLQTISPEQTAIASETLAQYQADQLWTELGHANLNQVKRCYQAMKDSYRKRYDFLNQKQATAL